KTAKIKILSQNELELPQDQIGLAGSPTSIVRIFRPQWSRSGQIEQAGNNESLSAALTALDSMLDSKGLS
ncbi:MAG: hypothetical protein Q4G59_04035, partial [Planctomycetia bacterium]|nr:hypothetical protein [Planctomycetia bacterium]